MSPKKKKPTLPSDKITEQFPKDIRLCGKCNRIRKKYATPKDTDVCPCGAPEKYKEEFCEIAISLGAQGKSRHGIAAALDVELEKLAGWESRHPEFGSAMRRAMQLSQTWWEDFAHDNLMTHRDFRVNEKLYSLNMMNRFGWGKKEDVTVEGGLAKRLAQIEEKASTTTPPPDEKDSTGQPLQ